MKTKTFILAIVGVTVAGMVAFAAPGQRFGTDVFHFHVQSALVDQGVEPGADGVVRGLHDRQGQADIQKFDIMVSGLTPTTPYEVDALIDGNSDFVPVDAFVTDANGAAALHYQKIINNHGASQANGRGKRALPGAMDPVNMVIGIAIVNTNVQPVLAADLLNPDHLQVQIKRDISSDQVPALLTIHGNDTRATVKIAASNLVPNSTYALAVNNTILATNNASAGGRLSIDTQMTSQDLLHVFSVTLLDDTGANVVGTMLP